ncbi:MAG: tRNA dihydrouridine synthase DusB [Deltaproteobacteria bacterium]|nr:MAG: tRNA dihydrouridine synthase DusB [Deltaproteobacteria bacterium]
MAGVTDSPFRRLNRRLGCPVVVTEMVSTEGIIRNQPNTLRLLRFDEEEHPIIVQLFGHRPEAFGDAARVCEDMGFDGIDINMGCPVRKVVGHGAGAGLLKDPQNAVAIVRAVRGATNLPVSVKLRAGWSTGDRSGLELAQECARQGVDCITLHARTRQQFYSGRADWNLIGELASKVDVPVFGNGDVWSPDDALRMVEQTGCHGVAIGRGALGDPWLCGAAAALLDGGTPDYPPEGWQRYEMFCIHLDFMIDYMNDESRAVRVMRKHLAWYSRGIEGAAKLRRNLGRMVDAQQMKSEFERLVKGAVK